MGSQRGRGFYGEITEVSLGNMGSMPVPAGGFLGLVVLMHAGDWEDLGLVDMSPAVMHRRGLGLGSHISDYRQIKKSQ